METQKQEIKQLCSKFMLTGMGAQLESMVTDAEKQGMGFMQFTLALLQSKGSVKSIFDRQWYLLWYFVFKAAVFIFMHGNNRSYANTITIQKWLNPKHGSQSDKGFSGEFISIRKG